MTDTHYERTLLLLRHAKSSWADDSLDDFDRPLNGRGRRDAPRIGRWLEASPWRPELILCSSARRTRETWAGVEQELSWRPQVRFEDRLYHASCREVLSQIEALLDGVTTACLIGHNPGIGEAMAKVAGDGDSGLLRRVRSKVPTGALAILRLEGHWDRISGRGNLLEFVRPKDLT